MKLLASIVLVLITNLVFSQPRSVNLSNVEELTSPVTLAKLLTASDTTDHQKVRSIFRWITDNIAFNVKSFQNHGRVSSADYWLEEDDDTSAVLKPLNERVAEIVLKRRTAVCDGYARLFKTLCDCAGIRCEIITGYAKTNINRIGVQFRSNHKWNAVFIDSNWYLLPNPPAFKEFNYTPFKTAAFNRNYISSFKPENGIIEASVGDSIVIELQTNRAKRNLSVIDVANVDSNTIWVMQCCGIGKPVNNINGNKVSYTYKVASDNVQWLNVIYDDELIMRYKLNIKKDLPQENIMKVQPQ